MASFLVIPDSLRNMWPIQYHFLFFICLSNGFRPVRSHNSSFVIVSGHHIQRILKISQCHFIYHKYGGRSSSPADTVAAGQTFVLVFLVPPVSIIPPMFHAYSLHLRLLPMLCGSAIDSVVK